MLVRFTEFKTALFEMTRAVKATQTNLLEKTKCILKNNDGNLFCEVFSSIF